MNKELFIFYKSKEKFKSGEAVYLIDMVDEDFKIFIKAKDKLCHSIENLSKEDVVKLSEEIHGINAFIARIDKELEAHYPDLLELIQSKEFKEWMEEKNCTSVEEMFSKLKLELKSYKSGIEFMDIGDKPIIMSFNNTDIQ